MRVVRLALVGVASGLAAGALAAFCGALLRARRPSPYAQYVAPGPLQAPHRGH